MNVTLPDLPYAYGALEPYVDAETMEIHHTKHHGGYVKKLNKALEGHDQYNNKRIESVLANLQSVPDDIRTSVRNNGGGCFNHELFWKILTPKSAGRPEGGLADAIDKSFGSFDEFKEEFTQAAKSRFGSGWAWLCYKGKSLFVTSTPNQDNPLMDVVEERGVPILGLDVWEHAYYLKYQNKRPAYIKNFWEIVNWASVTELYNKAAVTEEVMQQKALV